MTILILVSVAVPVLCCWGLSLRSRALHKHPRCPLCTYSVLTLTTPQCPECGSNLVLTGIHDVGQPKSSRLILYTTLWTCAAFLVAWWLTTRGVTFLPQPCVVAVQYNNPLYEPGEEGRSFAVYLAGSTVRRPWDRGEVTAPITEFSLITFGDDANAADTYLLGETWAESYRIGSISANTMATYAVPLVPEAIAAYLQLPNSSNTPIQTAQRIMDQISAPTVTGQWMASQHRSFNTDRWVRSWAIDGFVLLLQLAVGCVTWIGWLTGIGFVWRYWKRRSRSPWQPQCVLNEPHSNEAHGQSPSL